MPKNRTAAPRMITVKQAAARLEVTPQWIRQLLVDGEMFGMKMGRDWLVSEAAVDQRARQLPPGRSSKPGPKPNNF